MSRNARLQGRLKPLFYSVFSALFLSGALWWVLSYFFHHEFSSILKIHGALAMSFLIILGWMIPAHVQLAWKLRKNKFSGIILIVFLAVLITSGYGLYYFSGDALRNATTWIHIGLGLSLPLAIIWHIWLGRSSTKHR